MKHYLIAFLVGALLSGLIVFGIMSANHPLSATVNYSNSLSQTALYNSLASIVGDVQSVRSQFVSGVLNASTTASTGFVTLGPVGSNTSTASTTITVLNNGAGFLTQGDVLVVSANTTSTGIEAFANYISSSSFQLMVENLQTGGGNTPNTSTYKLYDFVIGKFDVPPALGTVTSTSS